MRNDAKNMPLKAEKRTNFILINYLSLIIIIMLNYYLKRYLNKPAIVFIYSHERCSNKYYKIL